MIMIYNIKKKATTGHRKKEIWVTYREDKRYWVVCMWNDEGGVGEWLDECSVNGEDADRLLSKHSPPFS